ncbi:alpha-glucan family phosphorylase [Streptomyces sp. NPDC005438]|uniref:alpha-glucan family phosphorylase n=1 Tax=Streptomyces sp. NPDC005438 TaxID=3156880 RepID=UPI0033AB444E
MKAIRRISVRPALPEPLRPLHELALNLRWSWHEPTRRLFASIEPGAWEESGHDPLRLLGALPPERLAELARDPDFLARLTDVHRELARALNEPGWYQGQGDQLPSAVAYFSPEFGVTDALPQYSGGLGILAGDHLKTGSDLGVPLIGVGLLYRHGYFRQSLSRDGWQKEHYPVLDPGELPLEPLRERDGSTVTVSLTLPEGRTLHAAVWRARVGRVPLLLLDSHLEANQPTEREVTDRLYGGGAEHRLLQELLLGIGGVRAVRAYCQVEGHPEPEVFHTNEGHAGFLGLERVRELMEPGDTGAEPLEFPAALEAVRAGTVFTTHTPVPAGIDRFAPELIARYFGPEGVLPTVPTHEVLRLGVEPGAPDGEQTFNMAVMGLRLAGRANGVSTLHGRVSRQMFASLWPGFDAEEAPITSVTNGVHAPTWAAEVPAEAAGEWDDSRLWEVRRGLRQRLVHEVRDRLRDSARARGMAELGWVEGVLDPEVLTVGFARRVPSYKRLTLMLRDPERLTRLLLHPERPVQLVVAGKAHPADEGGKRLIQELVRYADDPEVRHRIVFLPDYGMDMARRLYPGCDVWLNNPLRPLEACGTSGMKAALNGALNLSVLDGWWDEWYEPDFGWDIPTADVEGEPLDEAGVERRDDQEAAALYALLEDHVAPCFYDRDPADGVPVRWVGRVRRTLERLGPKVRAERMLSEYVHRLYAPAAEAVRAVDPARAVELARWKDRVRALWPSVRVDHVESARESVELGVPMTVRARVELGELTPDEVEVRCLAGRVDGADRLSPTDAVRAPLKPRGGPDLEGRWTYEGELNPDRTGTLGYTVRVLPAHPLLAHPGELGLLAEPAPEGPEQPARPGAERH